MRVLLVTDWPAAGGGIETYLALVARGLRAAGDEVRLLTSSVGGGKAVADYVAFGSRRAASQAVLQIANPFAARTVRRAVSDFEPDVVHASMFEMQLSPSALSATRGVPTVLNIAYYKPICPNGLKLLPNGARCTVDQGAVCWRGGCLSLPHWLRDLPRYARIRQEVRAAATVVTCSEWLHGQLAASGVHSTWSSWPVEPPSPRFRRERAPEPLFVFTGRLAREKGVDTLLRALARMRERGVEARLRVVGDGPLRPELEHLAADLRLGDLVEFTGWLAPEHVESRLGDAWSVVAPSLWAEPLGLTAIEALVRGIPVIASASGGYAETVEEGVTGLLFPNGDVEALSECLLAVASGQAFADDPPVAVVERARYEHDLGRHVTWLRELFETVAA
jgi:glycosyltransferase involved in cell wall biosynthesis